MHFTDVRLQRLMESWSLDPEIRQRACAHNLLFDERISNERRDLLENSLGAPSDAYALERRVIDRYRDSVYDAARPETFEACNALAAIDVSPEVSLVRLECLNTALDLLTYRPADFIDAFQRSDRHSRALVNQFIYEWNTNAMVLRTRNPISFAARRDSLLHEISAPDWPEKLRHRLGLAHYNPEDTIGPRVVALMEYEAGEASGSSSRRRPLHHSFAIPTALDGEPYCWFFPTPLPMECGCPMALTPILSEDDLIAEVVHPRMAYRRKHMVKLAVLDAPLPTCDLQEIRNTHLLALRISADRDEYGVEL